MNIRDSMPALKTLFVHENTIRIFEDMVCKMIFCIIRARSCRPISSIFSISLSSMSSYKNGSCSFLGCYYSYLLVITTLMSTFSLPRNYKYKNNSTFLPYIPKMLQTLLRPDIVGMTKWSGKFYEIGFPIFGISFFSYPHAHRLDNNHYCH